MVAPPVTATTAAIATYADTLPMSRSVYTYAARDVYQQPPPPTTAAYIQRDRVYPYSVPPVIHNVLYNVLMYLCSIHKYINTSIMQHNLEVLLINDQNAKIL